MEIIEENHQIETEKPSRSVLFFRRRSQPPVNPQDLSKSKEPALPTRAVNVSSAVRAD